MQHRAAGPRLCRGGSVGPIFDIETHVALEHRVIRITKPSARHRKHYIRGHGNRNTARNEIRSDREGQRDTRAARVLRCRAELREVAHGQSRMERVGAGVDLVDARTASQRRARASQLGIKTANSNDDSAAVRALLLTLERLIDERFGGETCFPGRVDYSGNGNARRWIKSREARVPILLLRSDQRQRRKQGHAARARDDRGSAQKSIHRVASPVSTTSAELGIP